MGSKHDKTIRLMNTVRPQIMEDLIDLNSFSRYLDKQPEMHHIQAICLSETAKVVIDSTGCSTDDVIDLFEKLFESKKLDELKSRKHKDKHIENNFVWRGELSKYFYNRIDNKRISPVMLGNMLSRMADEDYTIDKKMFGNQWHYMSNGYKKLLRDENGKDD